MSSTMDYSPSSSASSSSSTSSSSSSVHPASLVSPSMHSPALLEMVDTKITRPVIEYIVDSTIETVDFAMGRPSSSRGRSLQRNPAQTKFTSFVTNVVTRAEVSMPTLIATLAYIDRARPHLHIALEEWALERVFLGALIVASKYTNDSTLKNVHWAMCTGVFGKRDVGRIEREFLDVLDWELGLAESDLLSHHDGLTRALHKRHAQHLHPAFASQPDHKHFASITSTSRHHKRVSTSSSSSSESSISSSSEDDSMDSPRTPAQPSPVPTKHEHQKQRSHGMDLLKSFPLPLPIPRHSSQPLRLSA